MDIFNHERFVAGNQELREILWRAEALEETYDGLTELDLESIKARLMSLKPEIGDASRSETLDVRLLDQVAEYVKNFRALQQVIEKIVCTSDDAHAASDAARSQPATGQDYAPAAQRTA